MSKVVIRLKLLSVYALALVLGAGLLHVSQAVQREEKELAIVKMEQEQVLESIDVLEAEWAFLSSPGMLEYIANDIDMASDQAPTLISGIDEFKRAREARRVLSDVSFVPPRKPQGYHRP